MHPDHLYQLAQLRLAEAQSHRHARQGLTARPRPPGRVRARTANLLVRLASRLTDEPVVVLPRRV